MRGTKRREFLKSSIVSAAGITGLATGMQAVAAPVSSAPAETAGTTPPFHLGLVNYNLARDWDIETIIGNCEKTGFAGGSENWGSARSARRTFKRANRW